MKQTIPLLAGMHGCVLRADSLEQIVVYPVLNAAQRIGAQYVHVILFRDLIPQLFHLDCSLASNCPQWRIAFSTDRDARLLSFRSFACVDNEITRNP